MPVGSSRLLDAVSCILSHLMLIAKWQLVLPSAVNLRCGAHGCVGLGFCFGCGLRSKFRFSRWFEQMAFGRSVGDVPLVMVMLSGCVGVCVDVVIK